MQKFNKNGINGSQDFLKRIMVGFDSVPFPYYQVKA
tara:strand:- start:14 stop:121 length:108 start_codon:yes stop_codon:yes gene_type:complete